MTIFDKVIFIDQHSWYRDDEVVLDNWSLWVSSTPYLIGYKTRHQIIDAMTSDGFSIMTKNKTFTNKEKWRGIIVYECG